MKKTKRSALLVMAVTAAIMTTATIAYADDSNVTITGDSLALGAISTSDFAGITLDGAAQATTATMSGFDVTDPRGTGLGWNITISASSFKEYAGEAYVASGETLGASRFSMASATVAKVDASSSDAPAMTAGTYMLDADANSDGTSEAVKIASAGTDTGMGSYTVTPGELSLSVPASVYATTYRSDVTVTLSTGP